MLEFIQIPMRDFFNGERAYFDGSDGRSYVVLEHSTGMCSIGKPLGSFYEKRGTFVEKHGLTYIDLKEPNFYA